MKKLQSLAFFVLVTPAITLSSGTLLAAEDSSDYRDIGEQSLGDDVDSESESEEQHQDSTKSTYNDPAPTDTEMGDQSGAQSKDYLDSMPANGMAASDLIGTDLKTSDGERMGKINELVIDQDGKVGAVLVDVGGFLAMGEKRIAIDWNAVKKSGNPGNRDLRVNMTRDDLQSAPSYQ